MHLLSSVAIWPNLEMKSWPKQCLDSLLLVTLLPEPTHFDGYLSGFTAISRMLMNWLFVKFVDNFMVISSGKPSILSARSGNPY